MLSDERKGIQIFPTWPVVVASAYLWSEMCDERLSNGRSVEREIDILEDVAAHRCVISVTLMQVLCIALLYVLL
jgi:hypothetical protein